MDGFPGCIVDEHVAAGKEDVLTETLVFALKLNTKLSTAEKTQS
jgi:hypothetical protein